MRFLNWLIPKKTPEEELLEKFCDMHLTWERETEDLIRYRSTFQIKEPSTANVSQGIILIWEYVDCYAIRITYDASEEPLMFYSKTYEAKSLIEQARAQVNKRDKEAEQKDQDKLQAQCKNIFKLLS